MGWTEEAWTGVAWTEWVPTPGPGVPREDSPAQDGQGAVVDLDIIPWTVIVMVTAVIETLCR